MCKTEKQAIGEVNDNKRMEGISIIFSMSS